MLSYKTGKVLNVKELDENIEELKVDLGYKISKSLNYIGMTGRASIGDQVIINTTATELGLGTGGVDFVIINNSCKDKKFEREGHIMKMRYTPLQIKCLAVEEEGSPYHDKFLNFDGLDGHVCIVGTLHSMLAPLALMLKYKNPKLKINYVMTDGGCLPISFSNTVRRLKNEEIIYKTITIGHAFGGDFESINIYNGIIASKLLGEADITIVTMGPGIVGSGTKYGFTGIEQGDIINAVNTLGGRAILVPRVGFSDARARHRGLSHQTRTVIEEIVRTPCDMVIHELDDEKKSTVESQLARLNENVNIVYQDGRKIEKALKYYNYNITTMGRGISEEEDYFYTLGAVAEYAYRLFEKEE